MPQINTREKIIFITLGIILTVEIFFLLFQDNIFIKDDTSTDTSIISSDELSLSVAADRGSLMAFISSLDKIEFEKNILDNPKNRLKYIEHYFFGDAETTNYIDYSMDKDIFVEKYTEFFDEKYDLSNSTCPNKPNKYCWQEGQSSNSNEYELINNDITSNNTSSGVYEIYSDDQDDPITGVYEVTYKKINGQIVIDTIIFKSN